MTCPLPNESRTDRIVRFLLSAVLFFLAFFVLKEVWKDVVYVLSAAALFTSLSGYCALYPLFNFKTIK